MSTVGAGTQGDHGSGWVHFAGIMLGLAGTLNVVYGIAAIDGSEFFVQDAEYVLSDLKTYGWILLIVGVAQLLAGVGTFRRSPTAATAGIVLASINALAQMLWIPAEPLLSLALLGVDILIIYGLVTYGRRPALR